MKKVAFYTLGCKLNFSETSAIAAQLIEQGYRKVDFQETPDVFIINTCSVTENADKKCGKVVREAKRVSPHAFVAVIGCYAQLKPQEIIAIPGVDAVLGAAEKFKLLELLPNFEKRDKPAVFRSALPAHLPFHAAHSSAERTRAFLKIQDGCDYSCSFCTIPLARGGSRSEQLPKLVRQAEELGRQGAKEIVITGVNIGDYGLINGNREYSFLALLQALDSAKHIERFRISSIEPNLLTPEILSFIVASEKFTPHFHIPLQSGCDKTLKAMRRRYLRKLHLERVELAQSLLPNACIGADVIVGFPGETREDFLDTYQFINESPLSYLHVFSYSARENTPAKDMSDRVRESEKSERSKMLRILSEKKKRAFYERQLNRSVRVLFEKEVSNDTMCGFSENYIRVVAPYDPLLVNDVTPMRLTAIDGDGNMTGHVLHPARLAAASILE